MEWSSKVTFLNPALNTVDQWIGSEQAGIKAGFKAHILSRVVTPLACAVLGGISFVYHAGSFALKSPICLLKYTIVVITLNNYNIIPDNFGVKEMGKHAYKAVAFAVVTAFGPLLGAISPRLVIWLCLRSGLLTVVDKKDPLAIVDKTDPLAVSDRLFFHIHGDEFGQNSTLEGASLSEPLSYLYEFLKNKKETGKQRYEIDDSLLNEIHTALELTSSLDEMSQFERGLYTSVPPLEYLNKAKQKIQEAFTNQKPMLLPGGWIGNPFGHAMYYEIIPTDDGKASFRLYNLGDGINEHHGQAISQGKEKAAPYAEWRGIDQNLFLNDTFFQALFEMRKMGFVEGELTKYGAADIYLGLPGVPTA